MVYSPDGRYFATSAADQTSIWNLGSGSFWIGLPAPKAKALQFSPDGTLIAAVYKNDRQYELAIWHTESGQEIFRQNACSVREAEEPITLFFAAEGNIIGIKTEVYGPGKIVLWDYKSKKIVRELAKTESGNADLNLFMSLASQGIGTNPAPSGFAGVAYTNTYGYFMLPVGDSVVVIRRIGNARPKTLMNIFAPNTVALQFSHDSTLLAVLYQKERKNPQAPYLISVYAIGSGKNVLTQPCNVLQTDGKLQVVFSPDNKVVSVLASKPTPHENGSWNIHTQQTLNKYIESYLRDSTFTEIPIDFRCHPTDTLMAVHAKALYFQQPGDSLDRILIEGIRSGMIIQRILLPGKKDGFLGLKDFRFKNNGSQIVAMCRFKDGFRCLAWNLATGKELMRSPVLPFSHFAGWDSDGQYCWLVGRGFPNETILFRSGELNMDATKLKIRPENSGDERCPQDPSQAGQICAYHIDENKSYIFGETGSANSIMYRRFMAFGQYLCFVNDPEQFILYSTQ